MAIPKEIERPTHREEDIADRLVCMVNLKDRGVRPKFLKILENFP